MKHRVFIALPTNQEIRQILRETQAVLKKDNPESKITWVNPDLAHITLIFLGDRGDREIESVKSVLKQTAARFQPLVFHLAGAGGWPRPNEPKIVILHLLKNQEADKLHRELADKLVENDLYEPDGRSWRPHLTVGRNKTAGLLKGLNGLKMREAAWTADKIMLMKSTLTASGPVYQVLAGYKIG